jgi:ribonuclease J
VHVSGHATAEEMKLLIRLVKPRHFVPIHAELRQLTRHAAIARKVGVEPGNAVVIENGMVLEFEDGRLTLGDRIPGGDTYVDGTGVGDIGPNVMRERDVLGEEGFVFINLKLSPGGQLLGSPAIVSRGFVYLPEAEVGMAAVIARAAGGNLCEKVERALSESFYAEIKRRPMVFANINQG